jgi:hypothetical protein
VLFFVTGPSYWLADLLEWFRLGQLDSAMRFLTFEKAIQGSKRGEQKTPKGKFEI